MVAKQGSKVFRIISLVHKRCIHSEYTTTIEPGEKSNRYFLIADCMKKIIHLGQQLDLNLLITNRPF